MSLPPELQQALENVPENLKNLNKEKVQELFELFQRAKQSKSEEEDQDKGDPCVEDEDDCDEVRSPCCSAQMETIFGTLPLEIKCLECGKVHLMRDIGKAL